VPLPASRNPSSQFPAVDRLLRAAILAEKRRLLSLDNYTAYDLRRARDGFRALGDERQAREVEAQFEALAKAPRK